MAELASQPTPIQSIYNWFIEGKLYVNRRYQRKLVWTLEEKQKLIDSLLRKYPIPAILIAERETEPGTYEIIDGLQRLHAIMSFIETRYTSIDGSLFNLQFFPTAQTRADEGGFTPSEAEEKLSQREVGTILDYTLALSIMRNATEGEINDVFDRINSYGHRLSDQERRQAGVENNFSNMVRNIACSIRGDVSKDNILLGDMPAISIDLPSMKHGYEIQAEETFWVKHGILRSTDLRDSMDEQCVADIAACIIGGSLIERSKDALDKIYDSGHDESIRINTALDVYDPKKFTEEFKYCLDEILKTCNEGEFVKLRDQIFEETNTNGFPAVFTILFIAFFELIVKDNKKISNYAELKQNIYNIVSRITVGRRASSSTGRRTNINAVKGVIGDCFVVSNDPLPIYNNHSTIDIEGVIRRSEVELASYELKQGILQLHGQREENPDVTEKIINTICAMANNGQGSTGKIIIGVTDQEQHADLISQLDRIEPIKIGSRYVVGVKREATKMGISLEDYFAKWATAIRNSDLSEPLKGQVLSTMDFNDFYGLGLLIITIPPQQNVSSVGDNVYWRDADNTKIANGIQAARIAQRF
ncbi:DUF262 domain-containing protein [Enterobacillus tribolii]|uniref:Putative DNA-binding protein n=1 Tax=Enterobacillus tribolii TaxID=1487935 RepID=A0A370QEE2_9GAMM|nr:DUF262 domain-containing protein [Enterobacillus tribolii]MBW7984212.1 DUF262 domain-containing protein [Enterobacillus tribolii]RDK86728.1 putative DNA-binding protein [Enterobacillus tribolii]